MVIKLDVELDRMEILAWLERQSPRKVLIQSPLGLRGFAEQVERLAREKGYEAFISLSPTWGGCDIAVEEAKRIGADSIIHIGHAPFLSQTELPVLYLEARYKDYTPLQVLLNDISRSLEGRKRIGLGLTVQWLSHLQRLVDDLKARSFEVMVGKPGGHLAHPGQVLGCDYSSLKDIEESVDCFLVVGSVFHAIGVALISPKPTLAADPHTQRVEWMDERAKKVLASRYYMIEKFRDARRVGVLVSRKPGQFMMGLALKLKRVLTEHGIEASILVSDELVMEGLVDFGYDAYVNTACPRLSIEDQARFSKPLLLPVEVLVALNMLSWEEVIEKGLLLNLSLNVP